jgi:hypothetical protein
VDKGLFCVSTIVGIYQVHPAYTLAPASFQHVSSATHHVVIPYLPSAIVRPNVDRPQLPASTPSASAQTIPTAGTPALPWYHTIWPADMLPSRPRPRQPAPVSLQIPTASQAFTPRLFDGHGYYTQRSHFKSLTDQTGSGEIPHQC